MKKKFVNLSLIAAITKHYTKPQLNTDENLLFCALICDSINKKEKTNFKPKQVIEMLHFLTFDMSMKISGFQMVTSFHVENIEKNTEGV